MTNQVECRATLARGPAVGDPALAAIDPAR